MSSTTTNPNRATKIVAALANEIATGKFYHLHARSKELAEYANNQNEVIRLLLKKSNFEGTIASQTTYECRRMIDEAMKIGRRLNEFVAPILTDEQKLAQAEIDRCVVLVQQYRNKVKDAVIKELGGIQVFCKLRPARPGIDTYVFAKAVKPADGMDSNMTQLEVSGKIHSFSAVYANDNSMQDTNAQPFKDTEFLRQAFGDGSNSILFAFGQTKSGKTRCMFGDPGDPGLFRRFVEQILESMSGASTSKLSAFAVEINPQGWEDKGGGVHHFKNGFTNKFLPEDEYAGKVFAGYATDKTAFPGLISPEDFADVPLADLDAFDRMIFTVDENRKKDRDHAVSLEHISSRTHLVLHLINRDNGQGAGGAADLNNIKCVCTLVDLAGFERAKKDKTGAGSAINQSLYHLKDIISKYNSPGCNMRSIKNGFPKTYHLGAHLFPVIHAPAQFSVDKHKLSRVADAHNITKKLQAVKHQKQVMNIVNHVASTQTNSKDVRSKPIVVVPKGSNSSIKPSQLALIFCVRAAVNPNNKQENEVEEVTNTGYETLEFVAGFITQKNMSRTAFENNTNKESSRLLGQFEEDCENKHPQMRELVFDDPLDVLSHDFKDALANTNTLNVGSAAANQRSAMEGIELMRSQYMTNKPKPNPFMKEAIGVLREQHSFAVYEIIQAEVAKQMRLLVNAKYEVAVGKKVCSDEFWNDVLECRKLSSTVTEKELVDFLMVQLTGQYFENDSSGSNPNLPSKKMDQLADYLNMGSSDLLSIILRQLERATLNQYRHDILYASIESFRRLITSNPIPSGLLQLSVEEDSAMRIDLSKLETNLNDCDLMSYQAEGQLETIRSGLLKVRTDYFEKHKIQKLFDDALIETDASLLEDLGKEIKVGAADNTGILAETAGVFVSEEDAERAFRSKQEWNTIRSNEELSKQLQDALNAFAAKKPVDVHVKPTTSSTGSGSSTSTSDSGTGPSPSGPVRPALNLDLSDTDDDDEHPSSVAATSSGLRIPGMFPSFSQVVTKYPSNPKYKPSYKLVGLVLRNAQVAAINLCMRANSRTCLGFLEVWVTGSPYRLPSSVSTLAITIAVACLHQLFTVQFRQWSVPLMQQYAEIVLIAIGRVTTEMNYLVSPILPTRTFRPKRTDPRNGIDELVQTLFFLFTTSNSFTNPITDVTWDPKLTTTPESRVWRLLVLFYFVAESKSPLVKSWKAMKWWKQEDGFRFPKTPTRLKTANDALLIVHRQLYKKKSLLDKISSTFTFIPTELEEEEEIVEDEEESDDDEEEDDKKKKSTGSILASMEWIRILNGNS